MSEPRFPEQLGGWDAPLSSGLTERQIEARAAEAIDAAGPWVDDDERDRGPTDRPGLFEREHQRAMAEAAHGRTHQGLTREQADLYIDRCRTASRDYPGITRGREGRQR